MIFFTPSGGGGVSVGGNRGSSGRTCLKRPPNGLLRQMVANV